MWYLYNDSKFLIFVEGIGGVFLKVWFYYVGKDLLGVFFGCCRILFIRVFLLEWDMCKLRFLV